MKSLIISATGLDEPGIVSEITGVITRHGGNIEESRMSKMGSDFAIIMLVSVASDWDETLILSLESIKDLKISIKETNPHIKSSNNNCLITLNGADNEGIVSVLSDYLASKSINIIEMNTEISQAPVTGAPLFNLTSVVSIPINKKLKIIESDLESISNKLGVDIFLDSTNYSLDS